MRFLFVADGRSPIAIGWIRYFVERGDDVFLATTFACTPTLTLKGMEFTPVAYSSSRPSVRTRGSRSFAGRRWQLAVRHVLGPLTVSRASRRLRAFAERTKPDIVHAMRIPFEGMLAADAYGIAPLVTSAWGNDFTLHAPSTTLMRHYTEWALRVSDALHADCRRDIRLARHWGFSTDKPTLVVPGGGGIRRDVFFPDEIGARSAIVINARGARVYVRNDVFFKAIPRVLARRPDARFVCVALQADKDAERSVRRLGIEHAVTLLPQLPQTELADYLRRAQVMVSPSVHDGTPNSLLEGMACGCFPIAGDLESVREWISPGRNGLLVDATDASALADAIVAALENADLRREAADLNHKVIMQRADYATCMPQVDAFYRRVMSGTA